MFPKKALSPVFALLLLAVLALFAPSSVAVRNVNAQDGTKAVTLAATVASGTESATQAVTVNIGSGESRIMFVDNSRTSGVGSTITLVDAAGKNRRQIYPPAGLLVRYAALSPDGKLIAFVANDRKGLSSGLIAQMSSILYVMNIDGSHLQQLTQKSDQAGIVVLISQPPAWSSDSKQLLYVPLIESFPNAAKGNYSHTTVSAEMMLITLDGSDTPPQTKITPDSPVTFTDSVVFAWSPDGKTILFEAIPKANPAANDFPVLLSMGIDGKNTKPLDISFGALAWSPDGKHIAADTYIDNPDGSDEKQVLQLPGTHKNVFVEGVAWSPDSKQLVYLTVDQNSQQYSVYVINSDGSNSTLVFHPTDIEQISSVSWVLIPSDIFAALPVGTPTIAPSPTRTLVPTRTPRPTQTLIPTRTPQPTRTSNPTSTPKS